MMDVAVVIAEMGAEPTATLRERWHRVVGGPAPRVSPKMLRLALAWEIQARASGGLPRSCTQTLDQLGRAQTRTQTAVAGMRLVREWGGRVHVVIVGEDQIIRWDDREWRSLSEVARAITGTRWSGPAFFGLKKKAVAA
jgi:hypothetical protein